MKELTVLRERGTCCALPVEVDAKWAEERAVLLRALADPTRLAMAAALLEAKDPICICDFTAAFGLSQPTISHHVAKLREAGLVESEKAGIWSYHRLRPGLPQAITSLLWALVKG